MFFGGRTAHALDGLPRHFPHTPGTQRTLQKQQHFTGIGPERLEQGQCRRGRQLSEGPRRQRAFLGIVALAETEKRLRCLLHQIRPRLRSPAYAPERTPAQRAVFEEISIFPDIRDQNLVEFHGQTGVDGNDLTHAFRTPPPDTARFVVQLPHHPAKDRPGPFHIFPGYTLGNDTESLNRPPLHKRHGMKKQRKKGVHGCARSERRDERPAGLCIHLAEYTRHFGLDLSGAGGLLWHGFGIHIETSLIGPEWFLGLRGLQHIFDTLEELVQGEGLRKYLTGTQRLGQVKIGLGTQLTSAGYGDNLDCGKVPAQIANCFDAFFSGHENIRNHQIGRILTVPRDPYVPVIGIIHVVALHFQELSQHGPDLVVVVYNQNARHGLVAFLRSHLFDIHISTVSG
ncbi:hypothetical protein TRIP_B50541 [uncultured Desulfatiglans sp.]|uniref:Uncharacterized protein n=1 Tax=Uncultured Desulfatiglans sp. TaxID=1748965 RepID=A0A653AIY8_UNCDX|nr:hypothetical protein TRIP_B50541 [uncultured Desulfatiglans sp.]